MQDMNPIIICEDINSLCGICSNHNFICIEGHTGSGKTTLGTSLAGHLNAELIDTDSFIKDDPYGNQSYAERIDANRLSSEIKQKTQSVVLVGICLREVIELLKLSEKNVFHIYKSHIKIF
ncbi:shikimate kinase [Pectobacterium brasiliense]|uniref:shikimate kinase n=1 Tax=Pectobacterium brasiliense TaxID=180957 RepID=UPI002A8359D7|nr:shikimate kinase [Pectobacterium brasiliense]MDY4366565.1 shikimate kinase [Pectobacterium brasiliense]MDY7056096.1 shikimate kinase [Pectobacterium brasiliense]